MIKKLYWQNPEDIKVLCDMLKKDEIVISSTDTIYGFLGAISQASWDTINKLKEVDEKRPFLILIYSLTHLSHFVDMDAISEKTIRFISFCWPGPVTFIFNVKKDTPQFLSSEKGTVALRCPDHEGLQRLLHEFNGLFSTSANKSGQTPPAFFNQIAPDLLKQVNCVVVDEQESDITKASTLIDLSDPDYSKDFPFTVIREGAYCKSKLQEIYSRA